MNHTNDSVSEAIVLAKWEMFATKNTPPYVDQALHRIATLAAAAEREACARPPTNYSLTTEP